MNVRIKLGVDSQPPRSRVLALSACGSNSLGGETGRRGSSAPSVSVSQNADLAGQAAREHQERRRHQDRRRRKLCRPTSSWPATARRCRASTSTCSMRSRRSSGSRPSGSRRTSARIINGVHGKKYDMGISSFTINDERKKQVNMVSYFTAGHPVGNRQRQPQGDRPGQCVREDRRGPEPTRFKRPTTCRCGRRSAAADKIKILSFKRQDQATSAVVTGKADAMLADSPIVAYAVKQAGGKLETVRRHLRGGTVRVCRAEGRDRVRTGDRRGAQGDRAPTASYKAALEKWGVEQGAISDFAVNPSMTTTAEARPAVSEDRPGLIHAKPVRHPGAGSPSRVIAVLTLMFFNMVLFNPAFNWPFVFQAMNQNPVIEGFWKGTILVTILSMIFGVALGVVLAVMRLSDNPVLKGVSWLYTWFFRAIPRYVLLTIMGALGILFTTGLSIGVPFDWKIIEWLGLSGDWRIATFDANAIFVGLVGGVIGLGRLRGGVHGRDRPRRHPQCGHGSDGGRAGARHEPRQGDAAGRAATGDAGDRAADRQRDHRDAEGHLPAAGDSSRHRAVFPTAGHRRPHLQDFPVLVAATLYYLIASSVLMVGQAYLEKRFGRGFGAQVSSDKEEAAKGLAVGGAK